MAAWLVAVLPLGEAAVGMLEDRFPAPESAPSNVAGIVVLGGMVDPVISATRGRPALNDSVER